MFSWGPVASALAFLGVVHGHGGGLNYTIDGVAHNGGWDNYYTTKSIGREWNWAYTVATLDDPHMTCNSPGSVNEELMYHAPIKAGSTIGVFYPWVHDHGPILVYMARCPDEGCNEVDVSEPIWFKIWEAGLESGSWVDGVWASAIVKRDMWLDIPTPASLRPGKYLLRHEIINIETGQTQWFANCIHLDVSGSGDSLPADDELVAIPGAYDKDLGTSFVFELGVQWFWVDHAKDTYYPMPGPPVWQG